MCSNELRGPAKVEEEHTQRKERKVLSEIAHPFVEEKRSPDAAEDREAETEKTHRLIDLFSA